MDSKVFERFCASISALSGSQIHKLRRALGSLDNRMQALTAIEQRRAGRAACPYCDHERMTRWGMTRTCVQRLRCNECSRTFSSTTGTPLAGIHSPARFQNVLADMFSHHPGSCRSLSDALEIDKMTVWRWRQKIIQALLGCGAEDLGGIVEADEKFFRESRKGSREWVNHNRVPLNHPAPDRPRWIDFKRQKLKLPAGISRYQIPVLTIADRGGARRADVMSDRSATPVVATLEKRLRPDTVLCSDGDAAYGFFARKKGISHYRIDPKNGPFVIDKAFHIQNINSLHDRFERFMKPFRGPATKNLPFYASWFIARTLGPRQTSIDDAWDRLVAK